MSVGSRNKRPDALSWMPRFLMALVLTWMLTDGGSAASLPGPGLGRPATTADIAAWDIGIAPDGSGLPEGHGSVSEGRSLYEQKCQSCHGPQGRGATAEELAGGTHGLRAVAPDKTIGTYWPYATTLFDFVRRAMPLDAPGSLSNDEVYALTAYLLFLNEIVPSATALDAAGLRAIQMPNREGFDPVDVRLPKPHVSIEGHMR